MNFVSGLIYPQMKTDRAAGHLKVLQGELSKLRQNPYTITKEDDTEHGLHRVHVKLNIGSALTPISIGEFAYNLRSALDHLVWQLGLLGGRKPSRASAFPIQSDDSRRSREKFMLATWDVPAAAVDIIKNLQPHTRGKNHRTHPLWQLNRLCNLDKHATIGYNSTEVSIELSEPVPTIPHHDPPELEILIPLGRKNKIEINPQPPTLILGKPFEAPGPDFSLSESDVVEIHRFVSEDVLPKFAVFFPLPPPKPNSWGLA